MSSMTIRLPQKVLKTKVQVSPQIESVIRRILALKCSSCSPSNEDCYQHSNCNVGFSDMQCFATSWSDILTYRCLDMEINSDYSQEPTWKRPMLQDDASDIAHVNRSGVLRLLYLRLGGLCKGSNGTGGSCTPRACLVMVVMVVIQENNNSSTIRF